MNKGEFLPLAFTPKNILSAWEAVGVFPFNPRRALGQAKHEEQNISTSETTSIRVPKTPRAVSRATRTVISLVTRNTPSSKKLKGLLSGLSEGFQQTIADKAVEEEAHRQYRQLVGEGKRVKTSDRRKLTHATAVTSETVIELREQRERIDAIKAAHKAKKASSQPGLSKSAQMLTRLPSVSPPNSSTWEEMEALEIGRDGLGESSWGGVQKAIRLRGEG
ncbi:hypothetical protein HOY82DRAFT_602348 [Tuber indicum]|nr:hypothetical protein HOY82DRAFT_602348 [Tuber indicum]